MLGGISVSLKKYRENVIGKSMTNSMCLRKNPCFLLLFILIIFQGCNKQETYDEQRVRLPVEYVFDPFITDMSSSSIIALPGGVYFEGKAINSTPELIEHVPSSVIASSPLYKEINYSTNSLLSLKSLLFYYPDKLEYKVHRKENGEVVVTQIIYASKPMDLNGYFVMSNLVTSKIMKNEKISLEQSLSFDYGEQ